MRPSGRAKDELRTVTLETDVNKHAEGSCLIKMGETQVLCLASVEERVPPWMRNSGSGWVTAEYGMLPRSTGSRMNREATRGKQSGRTLEIQRLIGRSLRAVTDLSAMGEIQITVDCDVIQADGGTRTASITGGTVALCLALKKINMEDAINNLVAAVSVGVNNKTCLLDLNYEEDSSADSDINIVMNENLDLIEVQGTAEEKPFSKEEFSTLINLAENGIKDLISLQREIIEDK